MKNGIRVLNVDDSAFVRSLLKDLFMADGGFSVIDQAKNGKEAIDLLKDNDYDVITLDIYMPVMDGLATLKEIMRIKPTPVVMLSSSTKEGVMTSFDALDLGAIDFITKPKNIFSANRDSLRKEVVEQVKNATKANLTLVKRESPIHKKGVEFTARQGDRNQRNTDIVKTIIAIGTSTGGPRALHQLLPKISADIKAPILIVQHMPKGFTKSLAERLNTLSDLTVKEAEQGEVLKNGFVYVAPGGNHMRIKSIGVDKFSVVLDEGEYVNGHRPSVDAMMISVSEQTIKNVVAVIMTGMGNDGAKGLALLKTKKNAITIAEDEKTCVVYGMPKAAVETGKVDRVLSLNSIADEINKIMGV